jgi:hypothetical protein
MDADAARTTPAALVELARRSNDGLEVALFWSRNTGELTVCVGDDRRDTYFELNPRSDQALDCFHHPYSYAAHADLPEIALLAA